MNQKLYKSIIVFFSLLLFSISLTQNAITIKFQEITKIPSIDYFLMGSTAIIGGGVLEWFIWLANPLSLLSIILFVTNHKVAIKTSVLALALSASFLGWKEILGAESGAMAQILAFESGYYLWLCSILVLTFGILIYFSFQNKSKV